MNVVSRALKWSFLSEIAAKAIQPLVFVVLARLLTPEDYGVVASAVMVISFSQIFWEAGMGKAIIQYQGETNAAANVGFWINILLGIVSSLLLVLASDFISSALFHDERVTLVLRVMSLQVFLSASVSIQKALLQKDMKFKSLFWIRLATVALPGLFSIPLALAGYGYWALVAGTLVGQAVQVPLLWLFSAWKPQLSFDFSIARHLIHFGSWVAFSGFLTWAYFWADSLIVGAQLGTYDLGLYRTGNNLVNLVYVFIFGPILPVLYSHLAKIQADRSRIKAVFSYMIRLSTFIALPIGFAAFFIGKPLADVVLGSNWQGIDVVVSILGLAHGLGWITGANGEAYRAVGKADCEAKLMAISCMVSIPIYFVAISHGLVTFLWVRLLLDLAAVVMNLIVAKRIIHIDLWQICLYIGKITLLCLPLAFLRAHINSVSSLHPTAFISFGVGCVWIVCAMWMLERKGVIPQAISIAKGT